MELLLQTIKKTLPKLNKKAYLFPDAAEIAKKQNIRVVVTDYDPDILGYYTVRLTPKKRKKRFIMVNSSLGEVDRTFVILHELGHHFLHAPITWRAPLYCCRNNEVTKSKFDCEADTFALMAMIPYWMLIDYSVTPFAEIRPELVPYLKRRQLLADKIEQ